MKIFQNQVIILSETQMNTKTEFIKIYMSKNRFTKTIQLHIDNMYHAEKITHRHWFFLKNKLFLK